MIGKIVSTLVGGAIQANAQSNMVSNSIAGNNRLIKLENEYQDAEEDSLYAKEDVAKEKKDVGIDTASLKVQRVLEKMERTMDSSNPSGFLLDGESEQARDELETQQQENFENTYEAFGRRYDKEVAMAEQTYLTNVARSKEKQNQLRRQNKSLRSQKGFFGNMVRSVLGG